MRPEHVINEDLGAALSRFKLREAATLSTVAATLSSNDHRARRMTHLASLCQHYDAYFMQVSTPLGPPVLGLVTADSADSAVASKSHPSGLRMYEEVVDHEAGRIQDAFAASLRSPAGIARVHFTFAYYAACQFDGLRCLLWLYRSLLAIDSFISIPSRLKTLVVDLDREILRVCGNVAAQGRSLDPYCVMQVVNDAMVDADVDGGAPLDTANELKIRSSVLLRDR